MAAVDCGTNSTRLLVAADDDRRSGPEAGGRHTRGPLEILATGQTVTRLGQGVDRSGRLDDAAITRTVDAIGGFQKVWRRHGAERVRIVATSAVRDAADRDRFADAVAARTGQPLEVLVGEEEAALAFAGAVGAVCAPRPTLVLDIGGGSTELIVGSEVPAASTSRQLGCVRLTERALPGDPPGPSAIGAAEALIDIELDAAEPVIAPHAPVSLVAVAGTATTLGALQLGLVEYDPEQVHHLVLPAEGVRGLIERMRPLPAAGIAALGCVQAGREDVLLAGALILSRVLERFRLSHAIVSEGDLLDGLCREVLGEGAARGASRRRSSPPPGRRG